MYELELDHSVSSMTEHRKKSKSHYYFLEIVLHDQIQHFEAQQLLQNISYWRCLFDRFTHLKVLNMSLVCNDSLLQLIAKCCPCLEYLNATSKEVFIPRVAYLLASGCPIQVSDDGLMELKSCQRLRKLVINEPRERYVENRITYKSIRFLLRNCPALEDISYTDIVRVIVDDFDDVESLNLRTIRHHNPTATSLRKAFRLCKNVEHLNLINWDVSSVTDAIEEISQTKYQLKSIDFQNICFDRQFNGFFEKFGATLTSISLSQDVPEIDLDHLATIAKHCPNLTYLMCSVKKTNSMPTYNTSRLKPFRQLKSLHLMGFQIEFNKLLSFCTSHAENLETISLNELTRLRPIVNDAILKSIKTKKLRQLDLGGLVLTRQGIEKVISQFEQLYSLATYCTEDCRDISIRLTKSNCEFNLRLMLVYDESSDSYDSDI